MEISIFTGRHDHKIGKQRIYEPRFNVYTVLFVLMHTQLYHAYIYIHNIYVYIIYIYICLCIYIYNLYIYICVHNRAYIIYIL